GATFNLTFFGGNNNYNAGDTLTIQGGTFTTPAQLTALVGLTSAAIASPGVAGTAGYQAGDILNLLGGTATTLAQVQALVGVTAAAPSLNGGGSGYTVNDVLTVQGGTFTTA